MEEEFAPYEESLSLRDLGFFLECLGFYYYDGSFEKWRLITDERSSEYLDSVNAPLYQQAFRWFRKEHSLHFPILDVDPVFVKEGKPKFMFYWEDGDKNGHLGSNVYEEAELKCLKKLIQIAKNRKS